MRNMRRNSQIFWYALYQGKTMVTETDSEGNVIETGEYTSSYGDPVACYGNVSGAAGESVVQAFGTQERIDRTIAVENADTPIDVNALVWIDKKPTDGMPDYIVKNVCRRFWSALIGVSKVVIGDD